MNKTVLVAVASDIAGRINTVLSRLNGIEGIFTTDLHQALEEAQANGADLFVIDDQTMAQNLGLLAHVGRLGMATVVIAHEVTPDLTRRALQVRARDLVSVSGLESELLRIVQKLLPTSISVAESMAWSVFSIKGGAGKTTIAFNLAWEVARISESPVVLVDMDLQFGDIGPMIQNKPDISFYDVVANSENGTITDEFIERALVNPPKSRLKILQAPNQPNESQIITPAHVTQALKHLKAHYRYVFIDLSSGLNDVSLAAMDESDRVLVVTTPERVVLRGVGRSLDVLQTLYSEEASGKFQVVLNRSNSEFRLEDAIIENILGLPIVFRIASGGSSPVRAANQARPLVVADPKNAMARDITAMAEQIVGEQEGFVTRGKKHLWSR